MEMEESESISRGTSLEDSTQKETVLDAVKKTWFLNERAYFKMKKANALFKSAVAAMQKAKAAVKIADELYGYAVNANNGQAFISELVLDSLDHSGKGSDDTEETESESMSPDLQVALQIAPKKNDIPDIDSGTKFPKKREISTVTTDTYRNPSPLSHLIRTLIPKRHRSRRQRRISFAGVGSLKASESKSSMLPHHTTKILKKRRSARKKICCRWKRV